VNNNKRGTLVRVPSENEGNEERASCPETFCRSRGRRANVGTGNIRSLFGGKRRRAGFPTNLYAWHWSNVDVILFNGFTRPNRRVYKSVVDPTLSSLRK